MGGVADWKGEGKDAIANHFGSPRPSNNNKNDSRAAYGLGCTSPVKDEEGGDVSPVEVLGKERALVA